MNFYELQEYFKSNRLGNVKKENDSYVRVMSSNVLTSGDGKQQDPNALSYEERIDILCAMYLAYKPDFLGLQEVDMNATRSGSHDQVAELMEALGFEYGEFVRSIDIKGGQYGTAVVSKYPITKKQKHQKINRKNPLKHLIKSKKQNKEKQTKKVVKRKQPTVRIKKANNRLKM